MWPFGFLERRRKEKEEYVRVILNLVEAEDAEAIDEFARLIQARHGTSYAADVLLQATKRVYG